MVDYKDNPAMYEQVEDIPGEQAMFRKAAGVIVAHANEVYTAENRGAEVLDLCCGTAPILEFLPGADKCPMNAVTCVDMSREYLNFARQKYFYRAAGMGSDWFGTLLNFVLSDAVDYTHPRSADIILASSAYHHIENDRKIPFLRKLYAQLNASGVVVFCENLIADYETPLQREVAVMDFYVERLKEMMALEINDVRLDLVRRVLQYELDEEYEWKHSRRMFLENLANVGFKIKAEHKVWPERNYFGDPNIGDFVVVAEKV